MDDPLATGSSQILFHQNYADPDRHSHPDQVRGKLWDHWLLIRRSRQKPDECAYYVVFAPAETPLAALARVAGRRWTIEECFEAGKQEVGLADYEVRSWHGWYRHITLAMLALAS
ncbi:MAG: hypothetical protein JOZ05_12345 [Acetobacteraceae bacterium]|nr:hypothetical protein [Acetobacteraceae bacterium]